MHYTRLGFRHLVQLIVVLDTQADFCIDTQDPLKLKRRLRLNRGVPRNDLADEFHRAFALSKKVSLLLNEYAATSSALFYFNAQFFTPYAIEIIGGLEVQFCVFNYTVQHLTVIIGQIAKRE